MEQEQLEQEQLEQELLEPEPPVFRATTLHDKIKSCSENANPKWVRAAHAALRRIALRSEFLITPDVLNDVQKHSEIKTHDLRAIGAVMLEARKLGIIENAGLVRRNDKHNRGATTRWRSLIYKAAPNTAKSEQSPASEQVA